MPQFNLAAPEEQIVVSWLFEPFGYLDFAIRSSDGQTARQALAADPGLDVTQWVRGNAMLDPAISSEVGMVWWMWKNDQVSIPPPQKPAEAAEWAAILQGWADSIQAGFNRASQADRNINTVPLTNEDGSDGGTMLAGSQLVHQQSFISKVLRVLQ